MCWCAAAYGCSSRAGADFAVDMGELFVIRTAGQTLDGAALGTIEYGVAHLGTPVVLVLGHTRCGAVMAALGEGDPPAPLRSVVDPIRESVPAGTDPAEAVRINARARAEDIRRTVPGVTASAGCQVASAVMPTRPNPAAVSACFSLIT